MAARSSVVSVRQGRLVIEYHDPLTYPFARDEPLVFTTALRVKSGEVGCWLRQVSVVRPWRSGLRNFVSVSERTPSRASCWHLLGLTPPQHRFRFARDPSLYVTSDDVAFTRCRGRRSQNCRRTNGGWAGASRGRRRSEAMSTTTFTSVSRKKSGRPGRPSTTSAPRKWDRGAR